MVGAGQADAPELAEEELMFLDAVLHLSARAVKALAQVAGRRGSGIEVGDDESRVGTLGEMLRLGYDPPLACPGFLVWQRSSLKTRAPWPDSAWSPAASLSSLPIARWRRLLRASPRI